MRYGDRLKWDENKLKTTEKQQKEQVLMKVDEPNTPYIRYDSVTDKVTNWEGICLYLKDEHVINKLVQRIDLPENIRAAHEEPEEFALDAEKVPETSKKSGIAFENEPDEWQNVDEKERQDKEETGMFVLSENVEIA